MADEETPTVSEPEQEQPVTEVDEEASSQAAPEQPVAPVPAPTVSSQPGHKKRKLIIIAIVVVVLALAGGAYALVKHHHKTPTPKAAVSQKVTKPKVNNAAQFVDNYLPAPVDVSPRPNFFSDYKSLFGTDCSGENVDYTNAAAVAACPVSVTAADMVYKQIGTTKAGLPIIVADNGQGGEANQTFMALETSSGHYAILAKYDASLASSTGYSASDVAKNIAGFKAALDPSTTLDTTTELADLTYPTSFSYGGATFNQSYKPTTPDLAGYPLVNGLEDIRGGYYGSAQTSAVTALGKVGAKTVYQVKVQNSTNYQVNEIYLGVNADDAASYVLNDGIVTDSQAAPKISWSDGTTNKDIYTSHPQGCGSADGYIVAKNVTAADLTAVGSGPNSQTLYELPTSAPLFQEIYNDDYGSGTNLNNAAYKNLTAAQLQAKHVVFLAKNGLGEYIVYEDQNYFTGGGCGKPVVYLYSTKTELVNVSVAADVKKSLPLYGANGWQNVLARPNGQLTYQGASYPNLYWEGAGSGVYPAVDQGTVVAAQDAPATIRQQLEEQGLKSSEINDFMAYWQPRLPNTPYIRLTWFNTAQMNQLAPLTISPKPDTLIRVFLDFQGLNRHINLPAQHFSTPLARNGFTVVEWGGLQRNR